MDTDFGLADGGKYRVKGYGETFTAQRASTVPHWIADPEPSPPWQLSYEEGAVMRYQGTFRPPHRSRSFMLWVKADGSIYTDGGRSTGVHVRDVERVG